MSTDSLIVEYIWTDTDGITFRSKTRMFYGEQAAKLDTDPANYPKWTYDGSSTGDVNNYGEPSCQTECRLVPYFVYTAPECHVADRYVLCMSKTIRDTDFCEMCNTIECVCLNAPDEQPFTRTCRQNKCNLISETNEIVEQNAMVSCDSGSDEAAEDIESEAEEAVEVEDEQEAAAEEVEEMDDETIEYILNTEDDDIGALYEDDSRPTWPDKDFEDQTSCARRENDDAIDMWMVHPKVWKHRPMIGFEQEFFVIDPETGYPVGFVQSACPFTRALSHLGLRPRYTPVSGGQGPYYCSNGFPKAQLREMMDEVLLVAREMEIGIAGFNYEVAPGQAEFQVFGDAWEACNDLVMLRFLLVRTAEKYGLKIDFRPVVVRGQNINNSGCHVNFSTEKMRAEKGLDYIYAFLDYMSDIAEEYPCDRKFEFENLYGRGVCERLTGRLETSHWMDFTWDIGTRDTSVRIPISVNEAKCGYFEDRRPGANVNPYVISWHIFERVLAFENLVYAANIERQRRAQAAKDAKEAAAQIQAQADAETSQAEQPHAELDTEFTPEEPEEQTESDEEDEQPRSIAGKVLSALGF
jgi:glutamine synthetase